MEWSDEVCESVQLADPAEAQAKKIRGYEEKSSPRKSDNQE